MSILGGAKKKFWEPRAKGLLVGMGVVVWAVPTLS